MSWSAAIALYRLLSGEQGAAFGRILMVGICIVLYWKQGADRQRFDGIDAALGRVEDAQARLPEALAQRDGEIKGIEASIEGIRQAAQAAAAKADRAAELGAQHTGVLSVVADRLRELSAKLDGALWRLERSQRAERAPLPDPGRGELQ